MQENKQTKDAQSSTEKITKTGSKGIKLMHDFEGCHKIDKQGRVVPYICPAGVLTVGYGTTRAVFPELKPNMVFTKQEVEELFKRTLVVFEEGVAKLIKAPYNQNQFDAMVSLAYNIGLTNFGKSSVVRRFNSGDTFGAANAFLMWNKANGRVLGGLERRRQAERKLFLEAI